MRKGSAKNSPAMRPQSRRSTSTRGIPAASAVAAEEIPRVDLVGNRVELLRHPVGDDDVGRVDELPEVPHHARAHEVRRVELGLEDEELDPALLLAAYYLFRGLSLVLLPGLLSDSVHVSMLAFIVVYGLDWVATVPPTVRIANEAFGDKNAPLVFGWVVAGHQLGAACAAFFAGFMRSAQGDYFQAFMIAGATGIVAAVLSLLITRRPAQPVLAAA